MLAARAAQLGQWWPFVLMTLLVWGLLPRLVALCLSAWRLSRATDALLREHSEITALLDRMATPVVDLGEETSTATAEAPPAAEVSWLHNLADAQVVVWNDAVHGDLPGSFLRLGSLLSDGELHTAIDAIPHAAPRILVLVKAWEPPMLEVLDMLQLLRASAGGEQPILVAPVGLPEQQHRAAQEDVEIWAAAVAKLDDPRTYVTQLDEGVLEHG